MDQGGTLRLKLHSTIRLENINLICQFLVQAYRAHWDDAVRALSLSFFPPTSAVVMEYFSSSEQDRNNEHAQVTLVALHTYQLKSCHY